MDVEIKNIVECKQTNSRLDPTIFLPFLGFFRSFLEYVSSSSASSKSSLTREMESSESMQFVICSELLTLSRTVDPACWLLSPNFLLLPESPENDFVGFLFFIDCNDAIECALCISSAWSRLITWLISLWIGACGITAEKAEGNLPDRSLWRLEGGTQAFAGLAAALPAVGATKYVKAVFKGALLWWGPGEGPGEGPDEGTCLCKFSMPPPTCTWVGCWHDDWERFGMGESPSSSMSFAAEPDVSSPGMSIESIGRYIGGSAGTQPALVLRLSISSSRFSKNCIDGSVYSAACVGRDSSLAFNCNANVGIHNSEMDVISFDPRPSRG